MMNIWGEKKSFAERRGHYGGLRHDRKGTDDIYTDLQRIQKAQDREKELNNQLRKAKAKLEVMGIVTESLEIE